MIGRVVWTAIALFAGLALLYVSRFWVFELWGREGLFGIEALRPQGGLLSQWLRGTGLQNYELLIWAVAAFLILSGLQQVADRLKR